MRSPNQEMLEDNRELALRECDFDEARKVWDCPL